MRIDDKTRLQHMLEAAREAISFADGKTREDLEADRMRTLALTRCIEIIGEAASTVSQEYRSSHLELPWRDITAMRNRLIHAYFSVNMTILIDTAHNDLPPLIAALETMINSDDSV
jgi:uncharacterized protein with HEPN domain